MKKIIVALSFLITATSAMAQNSLFSNISTTQQYQRFYSVVDEDKDGVYVVKSPDLKVRFNVDKIATGEGYRIESIVDEGNEKDKKIKMMDALNGYSTCFGYPYESHMRDRTNDNAFVAIDDYVFVLYKFSEDGISYGGISYVFIKVVEEAASTEDTGEKKKKVSMKDKLKALKGGLTTVDYGPTHKELQSKNLDTYISDYLTTMKTKQDNRTAKEKQGDVNLENAKGKGAEELKAYNDSIKATPEYQKMKAHQKSMEEMKNGKSTESVTINNATGKDIYIYKEGSNNSTTIRANSRGSFDCNQNYLYKFDPNSAGQGSQCYRANSGCGNSTTVN